MHDAEIGRQERSIQGSQYCRTQIQGTGRSLAISILRSCGVLEKDTLEIRRGQNVERDRGRANDEWKLKQLCETNQLHGSSSHCSLHYLPFRKCVLAPSPFHSVGRCVLNIDNTSAPSWYAVPQIPLGGNWIPVHAQIS